MSRPSLTMMMAWIIACAGCSWVPKSRLAECHAASRRAQSEIAQWKDVTLNLRGQVHDLTQRAIDDAGRIRDLEDLVAQYERSILAYQDDRERMAEALDRVLQQVRFPDGRFPTAGGPRLDAFARQHPDCAFDPETGLLRIATQALFEPGTDALTREGETVLRACAATLASALADDPDLSAVVTMVPQPRSTIARVQFLASEDQDSAEVVTSRAKRVREVFGTHSDGRDGRIVMADPDDAPSRSEVDRFSSASSSWSRVPRIEIEVRSRRIAP